jgi:hypothetical protein
MWLTILGFVLGFLAIAVVAPLLGLVFAPLIPPVRKLRVVAPLFTGLTSAASAAGALLLFVWIAGLIGVHLSYAMFFIPFVLAMRNDFTRINRAKRGTTPVALALGEDYDAGFQARMEYGYLVGDVIGILVPVLLLGPLPLVSGHSWPQADRENVAHFYRALEYANDAAKASNSAQPFSVVTQEQTQQELALLEKAMQEAEQIDDEFLDHRHNDFRRAFRELFQESVHLRVKGHRNADAKSLNRAVLLYEEWIDWFDHHKRQMTLPRPSEVL